MEYDNLDILLKTDPTAKQYFDTLPGYVREQISTRSWAISSLASLKDYAENLTRGDD